MSNLKLSIKNCKNRGFVIVHAKADGNVLINQGQIMTTANTAQANLMPPVIPVVAQDVFWAVSNESSLPINDHKWTLQVAPYSIHSFV